MSHADTADADTPKEREIRNDYDDADFEVQQLKATLKRVRMIPLSEEAEAMFEWRRRALRAEELLRRCGMGHRLS